jgi:hypothetical protein
VQINIRGARKLLFIQTLAGFAQWLDIFLIFSVPSFVWKADPAQIAITRRTGISCTTP